GTFRTIIVQISSATIAILQNFYMNDLVDLKAALPILLGDNVGTTITAVLAGLVGTIAAKRAAAVHVVFNLIGAAIFMLILPLFTLYVGYRSEEHTSELQSRFDLVCRLLLEKKKNYNIEEIK